MAETKAGGLFIALGVMFLILGALVALFPMVVAITIEIVLGWVLIVNGILLVIHSFSLRDLSGFIFRLLLGIITIIFGGLILSNILAATIAFSVILAVFLILEGILKIVVSFHFRGIGNWSWLLLSGAIALILGIMWLKWPLTGAWAMGLLIGIDMVLGGLSMIMVGSGLRKIEITR
jgi:uncharacterized membrane protein HdeD (DUF308 family)